jgi:uncharacterized phiE125 gp8 family phage protein
MSYTVLPDYDTLPTALLPIAKQHVRRTDMTDDDAMITEYLAQAIGLCEQIWELAVFSATVNWIPDTATGASRYQCPVQPVSAFVVMADAVDVSSEYALESASLIEPVWLVHSDDTAFHSDAVVTLTAGYADITSMPPPMRAAILTVAGTRYEHRESVTGLSLEQMPFWISDLLGGLWRPRA